MTRKREAKRFKPFMAKVVLFSRGGKLHDSRKKGTTWGNYWVYNTETGRIWGIQTVDTPLNPGDLIKVKKALKPRPPMSYTPCEKEAELINKAQSL
jgi:hypothetical protein